MNDARDLPAALTLDRLRRLAEPIVEARREAIEVHDPDSGETNFSLGSRTYERACEKYRRLAAEVDWLTCSETGLYFLLLVGEERLPIKFHHADPSKPPQRTMREWKPETEAKQLSFMLARLENPTAKLPMDGVWRLYYQDDPVTAEVLAVTLALLRGEALWDFWSIDLGGAEAIRPLSQDLPEAPDLDSPLVEPLPPDAQNLPVATDVARPPVQPLTNNKASNKAR